MLDLNAPAPPFTLEGTHAGRPRRVSLSEFRGKWVVLFFYPADFTFVCPTEVVGFGRRLSEFEALDAQVLGVSVDDVETHRGARLSFALPEDRIQALRAGYQAHIAKPVRPADLIAIVRSFGDLAAARRR